ncbi:hypothetical protein HZS55_20980 [Halosimplex rubrum]|uniref:Uncharacterized protein n=1 Tax=Halosimplex rubrum TaxID=869889 RepID=A0A7D5T991_9EURY|nr:hypothetical protein [Halosimplex rubrum]QLH79615.1 hypothetical protein HZS55_20980 [Halosimplex rubrum]
MDRSRAGGTLPQYGADRGDALPSRRRRLDARPRLRRDGVESEPETTEEAVPEWYPTEAVPYDEMWIDDRVWLPHLVAGETFRGTFVLSDDGESLVRYEMDIGVAVE